MDTISIIFKDKEYSLPMLWSVIRGYNLLAVVIDNDIELSEIDGPIRNKFSESIYDENAE